MNDTEMLRECGVGVAVANALGKDVLTRCLDLADVYHCEPLENTADEFIEKHRVSTGSFDNTQGDFTVPTVFDIAKVYKRLIVDLAENSGSEPIDALVSVYSSWISDKISDFGCSMYYESPEYLYMSYLEGEPIKD